MPNKILRGFQRRKSSTNVLDEVQNPPAESTFRVFERPNGKSFDGGHTLRNVADARPAPPRKDSLDGRDSPYQRPKPDGTSRGSGGTEISLGTAGANGSAASSFRLSTSSTNASSVDTYSEKNGHPATQRPFDDIPVPPQASARPIFSAKRGLRVSSFGLRGPTNRPTATPPTSSPNLPPASRNILPASDSRDRTVSASTASTATPPKLWDSDLALDGSELDSFGNMFDNIGNRKSRDISPVRGPPTNGLVSSPSPINPNLLSQSYSRGPVPTPLKLNKTAEIDSSPFSWHSEDSQDRLMRSPSPSKTATQDSPDLFKPRQGIPRSETMPTQRPSPIPRIITPEPSMEFESQQTMPTRGKAPPSSFPKSFAQEPYPAEPDSSRGGLSPQEKPSLDIDPALAESADLAIQYEEFKPPLPKPKNPNKVMTPAQFERYREQQERDRRIYRTGADSDSDGENDNYEDEDEIERDRKATAQRRKQEAQLAVYRQSMMKVTGEQGESRSRSRLSGSDSRLTLDPKKSGPSSADEAEDEDVPLGILAAHGFPNKNRPPTRLAKSPSNSNLGAAAPPAAAPSVVGESARRGNLPVFARNLPQDPYFGAGLVNQSNRESLAMAGGSSVYGVPTVPNTTPYPVHPAGLVGVIAGEERARAMRRGSPNPQGNYDGAGTPPLPGMSRSQTMGNLQHPGMMPGMMTPGDQAQIQMSQQMNQMMQMQYQWMQQMQQMVQMQGGPSPPGMPSEFLVAPPHGQRPQSTPLPDMMGQRSMSMTNTNTAPWNRSSSFLPQMNGMGGGLGYAPSLAPSERSNIGLASRYRPVSMVPEGPPQVSHRSSTFSSSTARPWTSYDTGRRSPTGATIRTVTAPAKKTVAVDDDDDDDEGWAEMKAKRDKKQRGWKLRKTQTQGPGLGDLVPNGV